VISFVGANLAIETNSTKLLGASTAIFLSRWSAWCCYGLGIFALLLAVGIRHQRSGDRTSSDRRKTLKDIRRRIDAAAKLPAKQAAEQIARALREKLSKIESSNRREVDTLIAECESLVYAPLDPSDQEIVASLVRRSRAVIDQTVKEA
jgi:hypothetical protein